MQCSSAQLAVRPAHPGSPDNPRLQFSIQRKRNLNEKFYIFKIVLRFILIFFLQFILEAEKMFAWQYLAVRLLCIYFERKNDVVHFVGVGGSLCKKREQKKFS
jgi:hypothetical protein